MSRLSPRGERIAAVTIAVLDSPVAAVLDDLDAFAAGGAARGLHGVALAVVVGRIPLGTFPADGPPLRPGDYMNVALIAHFSLPFCPNGLVSLIVL